MNLGDRVKAARRHAKLTQVELAKAVGITQQTLSKLEAGKSDGSVKLAEIAVECGVSTEWLSRGVGDMLDVTNRVAEAAAGYASQPARLDPETIAVTTRALLIVLRRRDPQATLNLENLEDGALFAQAYEAAASMDDELQLGAVVADLVAEREARRGRQGEQAGGADRSEAGRKAARK